MTRQPAATIVRVGAPVEVGFVFRDKTEALRTMTAVNFEVFLNGDAVETFNQDDPRVTLDATLGTALAAELDLDTAENDAGVGIVSVELEPDSIGSWKVYANGVAPIGPAETADFTVINKDY